MLPKHSVFLSILLFSFSTFVTINSAEESPAARECSHFSALSRNDRNRLIEDALLDLELDTSAKLRQDIVTTTEGFNDSEIDNVLRALKKKTPENTSFEELCYKTPIEDEREEITQRMLIKHDRHTLGKFIKPIVNFTEDFTMVQMHVLLHTAIRLGESEPGSFNYKAFFQELKTIIINSNNIQNDKERVADIEELQKSIRVYPSLKDMFHPKMKLFKHTAEQLKAGEFEPNFPRGMLFYGSSGVGKTEMVKALVNESDCKLFTISASQLDNQESGVDTITKIFAQAKEIEPSKGVIIFIDRLGNRTSRTIYTKILTEFNKCLKTHNNILTVIASNEFKAIDKGVRDRFRCIQFSCLNRDSVYKILKSKAQQFCVPLSEPELQYHANRMEYSNGWKLTKFIGDVDQYIDKGNNVKEAIKLAVAEQKINNYDKFAKHLFNLFDYILIIPIFLGIAHLTLDAGIILLNKYPVSPIQNYQQIQTKTLYDIIALSLSLARYVNYKTNTEPLSAFLIPCGLIFLDIAINKYKQKHCAI